MKTSYEVFELIEKGEWDLTDFAVWLNELENKAYDTGFSEGYDQCNGDIVKECARVVFNGNPDDGRLKIGMEIRDHFGIE